uniref:Uncharacterized protein n=2 Tax=Brassica oleracea TaxID=3712 RepID=A0A0D3C9S0_BRAOL|nr:unnamed protein product [Brassica oleracea]
MVSAHIFDLKSVRVSQTVVTRLQRLWEARKGGELMELHMLLLDDKIQAAFLTDENLKNSTYTTKMK